MMIKDVMPSFELFQPTQLRDAFALLDRYGKDSWKMAGGYDSLSWFKERAKKPKAVIDLSGIAEMKGIRETADGIEIGALTTLSEIERHPVIRAKFRLLADAAAHVASPQIRNAGTIGGNASQDARCWYYRAGLPCYRAGGNACFADPPQGVNREHALFESDRCVAVSQSDTAPALVALDAKFVIKSPKGERVIGTDEFFIGPKIDITRMTSMAHDEILTAIRISNARAGAHFYFEKVADRNAWDFPLVNVAAAMSVKNGVIENCRIACGGVSCVHRRLTAVEGIVNGKPAAEHIAKPAVQTASRRAPSPNHKPIQVPAIANLGTLGLREARA